MYRNVSGNYEYFFDDVLITTNDNFNQKTLDKLSPFKAKDACVYESKYLSGYVADGYKKDLKQSWKEAQSVVSGNIKRAIESSLRCDVVAYLNVSTKYEQVKFKYLLIPVYLMNFLFRKKRYNVFVNGSTAKIYGKTPVSPLRVGIACVLGAAIAILLVLFASLVQ